MEDFELLSDQEWLEHCERVKDYLNDKYGTGVYSRMIYNNFLNKNS